MCNYCIWCKGYVYICEKNVLKLGNEFNVDVYVDKVNFLFFLMWWWINENKWLYVF